MEFNLCYKTYPFKISQGACKRFFEQTGLDLQTVFITYLCKFHETKGMMSGDRFIALSNLYPRDIACKAMYHMVKEEVTGVSMAELEDASFRVGWTASENDDQLSDPWPLIMVDISVKINTYYSENLDEKKTITSAE
ncbi:MAG TPA: hypothetical protein EYN67_15650 [Flavobacteriales bacterium]|nr:hypothetical protein [Flavobacteriales bacterium]